MTDDDCSSQGSEATHSLFNVISNRSMALDGSEHRADLAILRKERPLGLYRGQTA